MNPYDDDDQYGVLPMPITAALLESQTPIAPDPARNTRMRTKLLETVRSEKTNSETRELYTLRAPEGEWSKAGPGVEIKVLRSDAQSRSYLLRMHAGARIPPHQHTDVEEECYVLEGEAEIGDLHLTAGDYHLAPRGVPHDWLISNSGALLLLRADLQPQYLARP